MKMMVFAVLAAFGFTACALGVVAYNHYSASKIYVTKIRRTPWYTTVIYYNPDPSSTAWLWAKNTKTKHIVILPMPAPPELPRVD